MALSVSVLKRRTNKLQAAGQLSAEQRTTIISRINGIPHTHVGLDHLPRIFEGLPAEACEGFKDLVERSVRPVAI